MAQAFIRIRDLASSPGKPGRFPVNQSTIFRWVKKGAFPAPVRMSPGVTAWPMDTITAWEAARGAPTSAPSSQKPKSTGRPVTAKRDAEPLRALAALQAENQALYARLAENNARIEAALADLLASAS